MMKFCTAAQSIDRLSKGLCRHYCNVVRTEVDYAYRSEPKISTVGLPIYKSSNEEIYRREGQACAHVFRKRFASLYEFLLTSATAMLNEDFILSPTLTPPGFHFIKSSEESPFFGGEWHTDQFPNWVDRAPVISLSILLSDNSEHFSTDILGSGGEYTKIVHTQGHLTIFNGAVKHRIGPLPADGGDFERITLQAHAARVADHFELFW